MKKFFTTFCIILGFIFISTASFAANANENVNSLWAKGNEAYSIGEFNNAIQYYSKIEKQGLVSAALYYNMGNAYYRMKENGKAILYYERTLKVDPANSDARINLQFASAQTLDKIEEVPDFIFITWIKNVRNSLSSNGWATLALVLLGFTLLFLLGFKFVGRRRAKKICFIISCCMLFFTIVSFLFSVNLAIRANSSDSAIVMNNIGNVKSAPNTTGNSIFVLHQGTKLKILEKAEGWDRIQIKDGRQGWIETEDIEVI